MLFIFGKAKASVKQKDTPFQQELWLERSKKANNGATFLRRNKKNPYTALERSLFRNLWDANGVILEDYVSTEVSIISATYSKLMKNSLKPAIRIKGRRSLSKNILDV